MNPYFLSLQQPPHHSSKSAGALGRGKYGVIVRWMVLAGPSLERARHDNCVRSDDRTPMSLFPMYLGTMSDEVLFRHDSAKE
jgi:hypothetical protein